MKTNTGYQGYIYVADPRTIPPTPVTGLVDGDFDKLVIVNNVYDAAPFFVMEQVDAVNAPGVYRWAYLTTDLGVCRLEIGYAPLNLKFVGEYPVTEYELDDLGDVAYGKWLIENNQLKMYKADNVTLIATFDLKNAADVAAMQDVFSRTRV